MEEDNQMPAFTGLFRKLQLLEIILAL